MNGCVEPSVRRSLTARGHVHGSTCPITLELGAVTAVSPSPVRPDKEYPPCRLQ